MGNYEKLYYLLKKIYKEQFNDQFKTEFEKLLNQYQTKDQRANSGESYFSKEDVILITYGDSLKKEGINPLQVLSDFSKRYLKDSVSIIHILPFFPFSSDDGFSVIDFFKVNPELGNWEDIEELGQDFDLMFDFVLNHISAQSPWFKKYLDSDEEFDQLAIEVDPETDLSTVTRPRALPLLSEYQKKSGEKVHLWTTFSTDQIDVNYQSPKIFLKFIEILLFYAQQGARIIRMDAIAYLWKKIGTSCIHLQETHDMVKLFRLVYELVNDKGVILTETNVPHQENISYFGSGYDEAQMVYNFTLHPLVLYSFVTAHSEKILNWINTLKLPSEQTTFFNFTASHDGIGVRPLEGIVDSEDLSLLVDRVEQNGGKVSYKSNSDGSKSPYELNIAYVDALKDPDSDSEEDHWKRFLASQSIALVLPGVPAIYIHSLLGSHNWVEGVKQTGRNRSINREKLWFEHIEEEINEPGNFRYQVFVNYTQLIKKRIKQPAFSPQAEFFAPLIGSSVFSLHRKCQEQEILALVNLTKNYQKTVLGIDYQELIFDIINEEEVDLANLELKPYEIKWLTNKINH